MFGPGAKMPKKKKKVLTVYDLAKLGNAARNRKLTAQQRTEIARKAGKARWKTLTTAERRTLAARGGKASAGVSKTNRRREPKP